MDVALRFINQPDRRTVGFQAVATFNKEVHTRFFSLSKYPSPAAAKEAAEAWVLAELERMGHPCPGVTCYTHARSNTGVVGVSRSARLRPDGAEVVTYAASWINGRGEKIRRVFTVNADRTEAEALAEAARARQEGEAKRRRARKEATRR